MLNSPYSLWAKMTTTATIQPAAHRNRGTTWSGTGNTLSPESNRKSAIQQSIKSMLEVEQADRALQQMTSDAKAAADAISEIDQAIAGMDTAKLGGRAITHWEERRVSLFGKGGAEMTGETTFAGSGSARNSQGQQVSALDELQASEQAAAVAASAASTAPQPDASTHPPPPPPPPPPQRTLPMLIAPRRQWRWQLQIFQLVSGISTPPAIRTFFKCFHHDRRARND